MSYPEVMTKVRWDVLSEFLIKIWWDVLSEVLTEIQWDHLIEPKGLCDYHWRRLEGKPTGLRITGLHELNIRKQSGNRTLFQHSYIELLQRSVKLTIITEFFKDQWKFILTLFRSLIVHSCKTVISQDNAVTNSFVKGDYLHWHTTTKISP